VSTSEPIGRFHGGIHPEYDTPELRDWIRRLPTPPSGEVFSSEHPHVLRVTPPSRSHPLVLKRFKPHNGFQTLLTTLRRRGPRAHRAFLHATHLLEHHVPTPAPVAWLTTPPGSTVQEEYFLTDFVPDVVTFREALLSHYYERPLCRELMQLLHVTASTIRHMHDSGLLHHDLGNQNILVSRTPQGEWTKAWIIDLHRASFHANLSPAQRGRDNARITLPSDLRRVFLEMQGDPEVLADTFYTAEKTARRRYRLQSSTRRIRHPFRARPAPPSRAYPKEKNIWIWDDRSKQAIPALRSKDKRSHYRARDLLEISSSLALYGPSIRRTYRELMQQDAWAHPISMTGRIGLSINLEPERFEKERRWLEPLGPTPLLVRLYHHETEARRRYAIDAIRKLRAEGHPVTVGLIQDRRAVLHPKKWNEFVDRAGGALSGFAEAVEAGHAVNRVKWGLWNYPEHRQLLKAFANWNNRFPQLPLLGPAGIDFEYPRVLPMVGGLPPGQRWSALSHHLYVDRRGAPDNAQSGYDTVAKLALARAMARSHPDCESERVIVSEVNWPLKGTGVWSPVGSPYQSPGARFNDPSVNEDTYADYMRRYFLLALCSGMADRVYWWNLAAHGFGLIDDRAPGGWRPRPAYHLFRELSTQMRDATFVSREADDAHVCLRFTRETGAPFHIEWALDGSAAQGS